MSGKSLKENAKLTKAEDFMPRSRWAAKEQAKQQSVEQMREILISIHREQTRQVLKQKKQAEKEK